VKITVHYGRFIIINYVSEHQLFHIVNTSHTMPTTHVNRGLMLLKLIEKRYYLYFRWVTYIPQTTVQTPGTEPGDTAR